MSRRDDDARIRHMLEYAREAITASDGRSFEDLLSDRSFLHVLVRVVGVVGEAASHISPWTRARYPDVPWRTIVDTRNRLIHGYDDLNLLLLWSIVQNNLPPLIAELERILDASEDE